MSSQTFDPREFLNLAHRLAANGDEASYRTAVGRAYYALFLMARELLEVTTRAAGAHGEVLDKLENRQRSTGLDLREMLRLRHVADYDLEPEPSDKDWESNWVYASTLADHVERDLSQLPPENQRTRRR